jgi:hypothetical protein
MFTQHPPQAVATAMIIYLFSLIVLIFGTGSLQLAVLNALEVRLGRPSPVVPAVLHSMGPLIAIWVYHPIRRRVAMFSYISWLKSFEEPIFTKKQDAGIFQSSDYTRP